MQSVGSDPFALDMMPEADVAEMEYQEIGPAGQFMNTKLRSRIDNLAEDVYEHFLRESCDAMTNGEWHEMALAVADRFRGLILDSQDRNRVTIISNLTSAPDKLTAAES